MKICRGVKAMHSEWMYLWEGQEEESERYICRAKREVLL